MLDQLRRPGHGADPSRELRQLSHEFRAEVCRHAANSLKLVLFDREQEAGLQLFQNASVQVGRRLAGEEEAGSDVAPHARQFVQHLAAHDILSAFGATACASSTSSIANQVAASASPAFASRVILLPWDWSRRAAAAAIS